METIVSLWQRKSIWESFFGSLVVNTVLCTVFGCTLERKRKKSRELNL
jgi:hypothetical protein